MLAVSAGSQSWDTWHHPPQVNSSQHCRLTQRLDKETNERDRVFIHCYLFVFVPSVLWHCWLSNRKSIWPVKTEWRSVGVVIRPKRGADCLHMVHLMPLPSPNLIISCSLKSRLVLPFWYRLTQVVLEKRPLNGCSGCLSLSLLNTRQFAAAVSGPRCCVVPVRWCSGRAHTACCPDSRAGWTENWSPTTYTSATATRQNSHSTECSWMALSACLRKAEPLPVAVETSHTKHTHTYLTALFQDYPGEPVPER